VVLRDFNLERPSLEVTGEAEVDPLGRGETYLYGERFPTPEEGKRLAAIRAEELLCRKQEFFGESTVPFLLPGFLFTLKNHYRESFNREYLIEEVTHEGNQTGYLISGLGEALTERERTVFYRNSFKAIPSGVQYRPDRTAEKPRIAGTMHARIDAEGSGTYAEIDGHGRYKVRLPFDINNRHGAGKASSYIRMAEPYSGTDRGMHFPVLKGTEVLLTFIDGDPDRPFISGTVPCPETPSVVNNTCNTSGGIMDGGSSFIMHNSDTGQRITLNSGPEGNSAFFSMGTGSPAGAYSQFTYEARNADFYFKSGVANSVLGALSQSMTAQSILWAFLRLATKHICDTILEYDKIGKKNAEDHHTDYQGLEIWQQGLLMGGPIVLSVILTSQMSFSLARHLLKKSKALPMANFGMKAMELHMKLMTNSGWIARIREAASAGVLGTLSNALTGWSGTYGVMIFNNTNSMLGGFLHPTSGSGVKLNPRKPDILIASGYGYIDLDAAKSITLNAADDIVLEGKNIIIDTPEKLMIGGGSVGKSAMVIEPNGLTGSSMTLESGFSTISLCGDITQPRIEITATRAPGVPIKQSIIMDDLSVFIGNNKFSYIQSDAIGVLISTKAGSVDISGAKASIQAATELSLEGKVSTTIGSAATPQVNINAQMLKMNGKFVNIGSDSILKAQATSIQLG
jgi:hypothetical protein